MTPEPSRDALEVPAPTAWPMVLGLGVTLVIAGLVTHVSVSAVGAVLSLAAAVGWWRQVLPVEQVEHAPLRPPAERAQPSAPSTRVVGRLAPGEGGHRLHLPVHVPPLSSGVTGGLVGGAAMAAVALAYGLLAHGSLWYPVNLLAGVAMPGMASADMAELRAFSGAALIIGLVAHVLTSMLVGLLYAVILPMLPRRHMLWGGLIAPLLWTGLLWALLGAINPALNARVDWGWFIASQIAFGLCAGYVVSRARPVTTMQSPSLGARPGAPASGMGANREPRR